jgi:hypothetical protein
MALGGGGIDYSTASTRTSLDEPPNVEERKISSNSNILGVTVSHRPAKALGVNGAALMVILGSNL